MASTVDRATEVDRDNMDKCGNNILYSVSQKNPPAVF